jgi:predicted nucleic acid-binding protein
MSHSSKLPLKIALDSNVFRNLNFINYITLHKDKLSIFLPSIVQLEVGYYYLTKKSSWSEFLEDIQKFNAQKMDWNTIKIEEVLRNAIAQKNLLPFKTHFRDFIIGTQCEALSCSLITYNLTHFKWLKQIIPQTPETFTIFFEKIM